MSITPNDSHVSCQTCGTSFVSLEQHKKILAIARAKGIPDPEAVYADCPRAGHSSLQSTS